MEDIMKPLCDRAAMQQEHGATTLPYQDLCYCTWTAPDGQQMIVDLLGTDEAERLALLSYLNAQNERVIWIAQRDQHGRPGTWLWTKEQLAAAKGNPTRIAESENEFADEEANDNPLVVGPITHDRRTEILALGQILKKSDEEVRAQLRTEGFSDSLPAGYSKGTEPIMQAIRKPVQQRANRPVRFKKRK